MAERASVIIVDIGGSKIAGAMVTSRGRVLRREQIPAPSDRDAGRMLDAAAQVIRVLDAGSGVSQVVVATAGTIDPLTGVVLSATDTIRGWQGTDVGAGIARRFPSVVQVENDARVFALGEAVQTAEAASGRMLGITIGTGIGAGLVVDGGLEPIPPGLDPAHLRVEGDPEGDVCSCGGVDHVEARASGRGMERRFRRIAGEQATLAEIVRRRQAGDAVADEVLRAGAGALAAGVVRSAESLRADRIVLGGGLGDRLPEYRDDVAERIRAALPGVRVLPSTLGPDAVFRGGLALIDRTPPSADRRPDAPRTGHPGETEHDA